MEIFYLLLLFNFCLALYSYKTKKLTFYGSLLGFVIGYINLIASSTFYFMLITFFISSSRLTKLGSKIKNKISSIHKVEKIRGVYQVLCNGGIPTFLAFIYYFTKTDQNMCMLNKSDINKFLIISILAYYSACNADTWASEVGVLSNSFPVLITTFKQVPIGTNGGISFLGTIMSMVGGVVIGIIGDFFQLYYCKEKLIDYTNLTKVGFLSGFLGCVLDSLLGAVFQQTIYDKSTKKIISTEDYVFSSNKNHYLVLGPDILSNNMVNFLSATVTSIYFGIIYILNFE